MQTKNDIEDTEYDFFHKTTAFTHTMSVLFQDSAKWVSANPVSANREDTLSCRLPVGYEPLNGLVSETS